MVNEYLHVHRCVTIANRHKVAWHAIHVEVCAGGVAAQARSIVMHTLSMRDSGSQGAVVFE